MTSNPTFAAPPSRLGRGPRTAILLGGLSVAIVLAFVARDLRPRPPLPSYGKVPDFHLIDERGAPFEASSLVGHVSVVDFIFTHCESSCPRLTAMMTELQARLLRDASQARLISFSVDPDNDTPPVLAAYAARAHADPTRWSFVTGPENDVARAVVSGFKVSALKVARGARDYDVVHGDWFVLVDAHGELRGYYPTDGPGDLDRIANDIGRLERERKRK